MSWETFIKCNLQDNYKFMAYTKSIPEKFGSLVNEQH